MKLNKMLNNTKRKATLQSWIKVQQHLSKTMRVRITTKNILKWQSLPCITRYDTIYHTFATKKKKDTEFSNHLPQCHVLLSVPRVHLLNSSCFNRQKILLLIIQIFTLNFLEGFKISVRFFFQHNFITLSAFFICLYKADAIRKSTFILNTRPFHAVSIIEISLLASIG